MTKDQYSAANDETPALQTHATVSAKQPVPFTIMAIVAVVVFAAVFGLTLGLLGDFMWSLAVGFLASLAAVAATESISR